MPRSSAWMYWVLIAFSVASARAQVEARTAPSAEKEIPSPMELTVPFDVAQLRFVKDEKSFQVDAWATSETSNFVCDKARVTEIIVEKVTVRPLFSKKNSYELNVVAKLESGYYRQDVDLTISILGADGRELARRTWFNFSIGSPDTEGLPGASRPKSAELRKKFSAEAFDRAFQPGAPVSIRLQVAVEE